MDGPVQRPPLPLVRPHRRQAREHDRLVGGCHLRQIGPQQRALPRQTLRHPESERPPFGWRRPEGARPTSSWLSGGRPASPRPEAPLASTGRPPGATAPCSNRPRVGTSVASAVDHQAAIAGRTRNRCRSSRAVPRTCTAAARGDAAKTALGGGASLLQQVKCAARSDCPK